MTDVHPKNIQRVMRHSTITLTMDTYGDLIPGEDAEVIDSFPDMGMTELEAAQANGTERPVVLGRGESVLASCLAPHEKPRDRNKGANGLKAPC